MMLEVTGPPELLERIAKLSEGGSLSIDIPGIGPYPVRVAGARLVLSEAERLLPGLLAVNGQLGTSQEHARYWLAVAADIAHRKARRT